MNFIEHIIEPKRLLLVWQSPQDPARKRFIVGELHNIEGKIEFNYLNNTPDFNKAKKFDFDVYPAFSDVNIHYTEGVLETFLRRLPPRNRKDFGKYLESLRIKTEVAVNMSDFALLGYSEGKLPSDGFSVMHPFENENGPCEFLTEIAGFWFRNIDINGIEIGSTVEIIPEPENLADKNAIALINNDLHLGYINRGQVHAFKYWIEKNRSLSACIEKVSLSPERPRVWIFIKVR